MEATTTRHRIVINAEGPNLPAVISTLSAYVDAYSARFDGIYAEVDTDAERIAEAACAELGVSASDMSRLRHIATGCAPYEVADIAHRYARRSI